MTVAFVLFSQSSYNIFWSLWNYCRVVTIIL